MPNIDDYLNEGIHGSRQTKPDERRKFLGSLRERTAFALTIEQVEAEQGLEQFANKLSKNKKAELLLNGVISINLLKPYRKLANDYDIPYTLIDDKDCQNAFGLVLCYKQAIDSAEILYVEQQLEQPAQNKLPFWKKLLGYQE
ncbi:Uncharacterized protein YueI [Amphibacillus marinus]|uniref:Uncharacterized protein YueI n=1 Tax=Amphibacillus marinus TaxID=872970 RepID=A0A1H8K178_9BACI|nr:YueI family protein [Amphibacillus marinus]SEN86306.1 Uncharacterized protein YueI [Amphibacillus marinus]